MVPIKRIELRKHFFLQFKICVIFTCISWLVMMLFPQIFAGMFTSDASPVSYTSWALRIYMAGIFALDSSQLPAGIYGTWTGKG